MKTGDLVDAALAEHFRREEEADGHLRIEG